MGKCHVGHEVACYRESAEPIELQENITVCRGIVLLFDRDVHRHGFSDYEWPAMLCVESCRRVSSRVFSCTNTPPSCIYKTVREHAGEACAQQGSSRNAVISFSIARIGDVALGALETQEPDDLIQFSNGDRRHRTNRCHHTWVRKAHTRI